MKHVRSYDSVSSLQKDLYSRGLEVPYLCSVSGTLDYNSQRPAYGNGGAEDPEYSNTYDGGNASSVPGGKDDLNGNIADKYLISGSTFRSLKWKI